MKIKKGLLCCSLAAAVGLSLCGCSDISFGEQTLLRPPRATGDQAEIQNIIKEQTGSSYTLKYPRKGEYRSAVTVFETGKDKKEYAVALYSTEKGTKQNISIISHEADGWKWVGGHTNTCTGIDRLIFDDINNDGKDEILVGWTTVNEGQNTLSAYSIEDENIREMAISESYTDLVIADITENESRDIMLLTLKFNQAPSTAKLLQYSEQEKRPIAKLSIELDQEITRFANTMYGKITSAKNGIVIDGEKNGGMFSTQVIYYDTALQKLYNPLVTESDSGASSNVTTRKDMITSRDINGDGIIELPVVSQLPVPGGTVPSSVCSSVSWGIIDLEKGSLAHVISTVMNYKDSYYFIMPETWNGKVTAVSDAGCRSMSFYLWSGKTDSFGDIMLRITRMSSAQWEKEKPAGSFLVKEAKKGNTQFVIAAELFKTEAKSELNINKAKVMQSVVIL